MSSALVEEIVTRCSNLDTITMAGVKGITDAIPEAISTHCRNIKRVSFRNCNLTDTGVCKVAVQCSELVMIALAGIHDLTDKSILALAENCPNLRELYISGCAKITKQAVTYLKVLETLYMIIFWFVLLQNTLRSDLMFCLCLGLCRGPCVCEPLHPQPAPGLADGQGPGHWGVSQSGPGLDCDGTVSQLES